MTASSSTKSRIMDVAETMFARNGFSGTSIRAICGTAGANQAAVHYHFKTKDDLALATVERRMVGIAARRKQLIDDLISMEEIPSVRSVVKTMVLPLAELMDSEGESGQAYIRMLVSLLHERPDLLWAAFRQHNMENLSLQTDGLTQALPGTPAEVIGHIMTLAVSTSLSLLAHPLRFAMNGSDISVEQSPASPISEVVDFVSGGITAMSTIPVTVLESRVDRNRQHPISSN